MNKWIVVPVVGILVGGITALFGTYWDDAWHTDLGRDTFFSPPHLVLYGGVALAGAAVLLWALLRLQVYRNWQVAARHPPLLLALIGIAATLGSAPIDELWHVRFGRDAVIWSPPHMLGVAALLCVAVGVLLETSNIVSRTGKLLRPIAGALVIGVLMVPVLEYETDVPQFSLFWYLPVLVAGMALAFALIRTGSDSRWGVTTAAAVYTLLRISITVALSTLDHSIALIPPILVPALVFDLSTRIRLFTPFRAGILVAAVYLSYLPLLWGAPGYIQLGPDALAMSLPLAILATWIVLALVLDKSARHSAMTAVMLAVGLVQLILMPPPAFAHDPGQGEAVGTVRIIAEQHYSTVELLATLEEHGHGDCTDVQPLATVARRAGDEVRGLLQEAGNCRFTGRLTLGAPGRWFIYIELEHDGKLVEAWLPVIVDASSQQTEKLSELYLPATDSGSPGQLVAGVALYAVNSALVGATIITMRRLRHT